MHARSIKVKLIAIFLVAFVCLNAGGSICVAYCQAALETLAASKDRCPLKKKASHCDPGKADSNDLAADSIGSDKIDCCTMPVSFIGAPVEKRVFSFETAAPAAAVVKVVWDFPVTFRSARQRHSPVYRGPPLDRRTERIKHKVIRI